MYRIYLSENDRPSLNLVPDFFWRDANEIKNTKFTFIPTIENMLDDAMLMISLHIEKNAEIIRTLNEVYDSNNLDLIEMYKIDESVRNNLYEKCQKIKHEYKLVVIILEGSSITSIINDIKKYNFETEICVSSGIINEKKIFI